MSTQYKGTPVEILALDTYIKMIRASESVNYQVNRKLSDLNLTISQFGVLEAIYHLGPMHQNKLADKILKSTGNMTMVIDNLQKRGLVSRDRDPDDRRCILVSLTAEGQTLIADYFPNHVALVVEAFESLSESERKTMGALLKRVGQANAGK